MSLPITQSSSKSRSKCLPQADLATHPPSDKLLASTASLQHNLIPAVFSNTGQLTLYDTVVHPTALSNPLTRDQRTTSETDTSYLLEQTDFCTDSEHYYLDIMHLNMLSKKCSLTLMPPSKKFRGFSAVAPLEMGEELNTPIICAAEPEFLTTLNAQSLKLQTADTMLNQNFTCYTENSPASASFNNTEAIDEATTPQTPASAAQLHPNLAEFDYNFQPYSVESNISNEADGQLFSTTVDAEYLKYDGGNVTTSSAEASPLGLNATDTAEQSFIFESTPSGAIMPIKCSQDYEDGDSIFDEINQISKCGFYYSNRNNNNYIQNSIKTEIETIPNFYDKFNDSQTLSQGLTNNQAALNIYQDEDSCLATVDHFSDVMINGFVTPTTFKNFKQINDELDSGDVDYCMLTPAPSPKSDGNIIDAVQPIQYCDDAKESFARRSDQGAVHVLHVEEAKRADDAEKCEAHEGQEQRLLIEHNYNINAKINVLNINNSHNIHNNSQQIRTIGKNYNNVVSKPNCKRKLVMSMTDEAENTSSTSSKLSKQQKNNNTMRRVPPLKIKLTAPMFKEEPVSVSTPDIANDILEMEDDTFGGFDLIQFITSSQGNSVPCVEDEDIKSVILLPTEATPPTEPAMEDVMQLLTTPSGSNHLTTSTPNTTSTDPETTPVNRKRRRQNSYDNPSSVQSATSTIESDDMSMPATSRSSTPASASSSAPKRRGRPPKTTPTPLSPSQLRHMNESDLRYFQMRNKNNEASRRSRVNRKDREQQIEDEAQDLESRYAELQNKERTLERDCKRWKNAVMKLAIL